MEIGLFGEFGSGYYPGLEHRFPSMPSIKMKNPPPSCGLPEACVVLGTYNGEEYLAEFVESVRGQSYGNWRMLIRDDGSNDATRSIVRRLAAGDARIETLNDPIRGDHILNDAGDSKPDRRQNLRLGPSGNFGVLLQTALDRGARYVLPADQDDVWLADKVSRQMEAMREAEASPPMDGLPGATPILVHADMTVVDAELATVGRSFFGLTGLRHDAACPLRTLLAHNVIPGCTMLLNRALLELAVPVPREAPLHDWWIALCAAASGRLIFLPEPTALYRQHGGNAIGARSFWRTFNPVGSDWLGRWNRGMAAFGRHVVQVDALRRRLRGHEAEMGPEIEGLLDGYCRLFEKPSSVFRRIDGAHRLGIPRTGLLRRLVFYWRLATVSVRRDGDATR